jgi:acyl carrier protein
MSMTTEQLRAAIIRALQSVAPEIDAATLESDVPIREQVDLDSMDFLNFVIAVSEDLGVDIPEIDYPKLATLNSFVEYLTRETAPR